MDSGQSTSSPVTRLAPPPQLAAGACRWSDALWPAGFSVAACLLAFWQLGAKDVWLDEAASAGFAVGPPESWWADHNMALYYALLGGWVRVFGHAPFALRSLSALCFVVSVPLFHALAEALFARRTAHIAAALYVTNALLVHLAQEARGYALAVLLVVISNLALLRVLERRRWRWAIIHGLATGLAVYAHLFSALTVLAQLFVLISVGLRAQRRPPSLLLAAYALAAIIVAPLLADVAKTGAQHVSWLYPPSLARTWGSLVVLSGGSALLAAAETVLCALTIRRALRAPHIELSRIAVVAGFLVPWTASLVFSACVTPIAHPRYWVVSLPAWLLAVAAALEHVSIAQRRIAVCALLACSALRLDAWYTSYQKERWSEVATLLAREHQPGDVLALDTLGPEALHYAVARLDVAPAFPAPWPQHGWGLPVPYEPALTDRELRAKLRAARRILCVQNRSHRFDPAQLRASHRIAWTRRFEPHDEDTQSLFADSAGRIITVQLLLPLH